MEIFEMTNSECVPSGWPQEVGEEEEEGENGEMKEEREKSADMAILKFCADQSK